MIKDWYRLDLIQQYLKVFFILSFLQCVWTLIRPPKLDCLMDHLQLLFLPEERFYGHVYVKGCYMMENCHLDFTKTSTIDPFSFNISYKNSCPVKCELQKEPTGISYHVSVIVQHHRLFLTNKDRMYEITCFYQTAFENLNRDIEVDTERGLMMAKLRSDVVTTCKYEVLMNSTNGKPVLYANIGDPLLHKWSCQSKNYGMLVHSCTVKQLMNTTFQFIDNKGCITDRSLMSELEYEANLTVARTVVPAFKFADRLSLRFKCKITLCNKAENGCKGITPPDCAKFLMDQIQLSTNSIESDSTERSISDLTSIMNSTSVSDVISTFRQSNTRLKRSMALPVLLVPCTGIENENCKHIIGISGLATYKISKVKRINYRQKRFLNESKLAMNPFFQGFFTEQNSNHFTLDVNADELVIFERNEINEKESKHHESIPEISRLPCDALRNGILWQTATFIILTGFLLIIIVMQKLYHSKRIIKCGIVPCYKKSAKQ